MAKAGKTFRIVFGWFVGLLGAVGVWAGHNISLSFNIHLLDYKKLLLFIPGYLMNPRTVSVVVYK